MSDSGALRVLTIEHLRGSVGLFSLPFEKGKKLTVIYGENGTGKSTICDAFEFLGKGKVGSLENRGLGKTNKYWCSIGKAASDVSVSLETTNAKCKAAIGKTEVICTPSDARPDVEVLRRTQILSLVEATPGDRYNAISRFIDVSGVEASEATLRQLIRDLNSQHAIAIARVQENQDSIQQFWEAEGKPSNDPLEWAAGETTKDSDTSDTEIEAIGKLEVGYNNLTGFPEQIQKAEKAVITASESLITAKKKADDAVISISQDAGEVVSILQAAKAYLIKNPSPAVCPLCESAENTQNLTDRINKRIVAFSSVQTTLTQTASFDQALQRSQANLESIGDNARHYATAFEKCRSEHQWPGDVLLPATPAPEDPSMLNAWLTQHGHLPMEWKKAIASRQDKKTFIDALKRALKTLRENTLSLVEVDSLLPKLSHALEIMEEERRSFTDAILATIADEVGRLYEAVHPGEGLNKISLELDANKRASLEISASFCGQNSRPQAYFSDSHLDTLGLCVFLALSGQTDPEKTILVLDDVLASVDEPHVDRLIEMLYAEVVKFRHCIITTHYGPWKHKLRWGWLKNGQCQFVELAKWSNHRGVTVIRTLPDVERLNLLLKENPPDPQLVCSKAGFVLEAALNFLTLLYECPVPRKPEDRYTIGDLLPGIPKKLRQVLRVEVLADHGEEGAPIYQTVSLGPILDELTRIAEARNVFGCHFKAISFELLNSDALIFGEQVLALMESLTDKDAGWPKNDKSGEYWASSGETRRLYPLRRPS
jgi:energy-coupling factor transporter ATP-binding protein EcfA2